MSYFNDHEDYLVNKKSQGKVTQKKKSKSVFTRGYKECRERLSNNSQFSRSCFNCAHYFQASGDKEEVCQRDDVLQYDMVVNGNQVYCLKWEQCNPNKETMFRRGGRSRLD